MPTSRDASPAHACHVTERDSELHYSHTKHLGWVSSKPLIMYLKLHDTAQGFVASQQGHSPATLRARKKDRARLRGRAPQVHDCIVSSARRHPRCAQASACLSAARRYDGRLPVNRRRVAVLEVRHRAGSFSDRCVSVPLALQLLENLVNNLRLLVAPPCEGARAAARLENACLEPERMRRAADAAIAHCPAGLTEPACRARQDVQQGEDGLM